MFPEETASFRTLEKYNNIANAEKLPEISKAVSALLSANS